MAGRKNKPVEVAVLDAASTPHRTLLHRLGENLRQQNWTAIGLEFLVVVFGVFLGLQATNWNAGLSDRRDEAEALREIAADIRQDRREMAGGRNIALRRIAAMREVLILAGSQVPTELNLRSGEGETTGGFRHTPVPDAPVLTLDERGALWSMIVSAYYPSPTSPSFDSLISSGRIDILRDEALVRDIQTYRLVSGYLVATQNETLRPISVTVRERGEAHGLSSFGLVDERVLAREVARSPELAAIIESQMGWAMVHLERMEAVDERGAALLARLEADATSR